MTNYNKLLGWVFNKKQKTYVENVSFVQTLYDQTFGDRLGLCASRFSKRLIVDKISYNKEYVRKFFTSKYAECRGFSLCELCVIYTCSFKVVIQKEWS